MGAFLRERHGAPHDSYHASDVHSKITHRFDGRSAIAANSDFNRC